MKVERQAPERELCAFKTLDLLDMAILIDGEEKHLVMKVCDETQRLAYTEKAKQKGAGKRVNAIKVDETTDEWCFIGPEVMVQFVSSTLRVVY